MLLWGRAFHLTPSKLLGFWFPYKLQWLWKYAKKDQEIFETEALCEPGFVKSFIQADAQGIINETYFEMTTSKVLHTVFPATPGALTQAIRNFAKSLESWLTNAMMNIPEEMVRIKVDSCISLYWVEPQVCRISH